MPDTNRDIATTVPGTKETYSFKNKWIDFILDLQNEICKGLEAEDGKAVLFPINGNETVAVAAIREH